MQERTGEIREYDKVPVEERSHWSEPFHVGEVVNFKGVRLKIIRIKQLRKQIILEFAGPE